MGVPLLEGRFLEAADNHRDQRVCVVDEDFAKRYWPKGGALGRRIANNPVFTEEEAHTIVGVVGRVKHNELGDTVAQGAVYYPYRYYAPPGVFLVIRTAMAPQAFALTLQKTVLRLDPELPVDDLRLMQARNRRKSDPAPLPALLAGIFAAAALLLASIAPTAYWLTRWRSRGGDRRAHGAGRAAQHKFAGSFSAWRAAARRRVGPRRLRRLGRGPGDEERAVRCRSDARRCPRGDVRSDAGRGAARLLAAGQARRQIDPMEALRYE